MPKAMPKPRPLSPELDRLRRISVQEAAELRGISISTFKRHYSHLIHKDTPRRDTCKLGEVLDAD